MKKKTIFITLICSLIILTMLFSFYIEKQIGFLFDLMVVPFYIVVLVIFIGIWYFKTVIKKNKREILILVLPVITLISLLVLSKSNIPNNIALLIEIPKIEKQIQKYKENEILEKNVKRDGKYIAIDWLLGVTDNWSAIVYDENNDLDNAIKIINSNREDYFNNDIFYTYKKLFGGDLIQIRKIKDKLFLCVFT